MGRHKEIATDIKTEEGPFKKEFSGKRTVIEGR